MAKTRLNPFEVKSCALIVQMDGQPSAVNLRELRDRVEHCSAASIYHHFVETQLRPTFDDPEFPNDFARWAYRALRDDVLAEKLGIIDPFSYDSIESIRADVLEIIEEHLSELEHIPGTEYGRAFYFMRASIVVFDTGVRLKAPEDILWALQQMTAASLYFHFVEARFRRHVMLDDFSEWLRAAGAVGQRLTDAFARLDVQFFSLSALRNLLLQRAQNVLGSRRGGP